MNEAIKAKAIRWAAKPTFILLLVWFFLGVISILATVGGYGFVPSTAWVGTTASFRVSAGLVAAVLFPCLVLKGLQITNVGQLRKIGAILIAPLMGYFLGSAPAVLGGPMVAAIFAGHDVELPFVVAEAHGNGHRGCRLPIKLRDLPFFYDKLCSVPDDLRQPLKPGMRIIVEGRGTRLGLYASSFRIEQ
ncbi:hypothetical protein [Rhizobium sp. NXC24]|uniref:hypothetical protein n=1 Tax=Rhizobium sp. NXC24 TaxID=2048897 RepID=UPI000CDF49AD|nr:hypothetical protein [Rhizobium sp. NXC24]AVA20697.1 hypothetical protein NXC24_CH01030 [Rhizobium sp. NXC24]